MAWVSSGRKLLLAWHGRTSWETSGYNPPAERASWPSPSDPPPYHLMTAPSVLVPLLSL